MDIIKKVKLDSMFLFLFFALFPFGQIIRIGLLHPIDLVVGLAAAYTIIVKLKSPKVLKLVIPFLYVAGFSWIISIFIFHQINVLYGGLYLLRLAAYYFFGVYVWNFVRNKPAHKKLVLDSLLLVSLVSGFFGWVQFFTVPNIKPFFSLGWDMHLFRVVGTFLDPSYLGLIVVFGLLLSIHRCISSRNWKNILIIFFLLVSLAFTYSRASYLAFFAGLSTIVYLNRKFKKLLWIVGGLIVLALILPTAKNHSIELFRTFSAIARIENYQTTLKIFSKSPVFGIGYNNMCIAYQRFIGPQSFSSHACSGSDSSLLYILATTGVVGFIIFISSMWKIGTVLIRDSKFPALPVGRQILVSCFVALIIHSLFSNSMFYPWIMGYFVILLVMDIKE
jgi:O-antigen ligase